MERDQYLVGGRLCSEVLGSSGGGGFHALPCGVCCTIRGTLIVAACAGFAGRLRGRVVTMVMVGVVCLPKEPLWRLLAVVRIASLDRYRECLREGHRPSPLTLTG
jgi:hypothetical protein